MKFNLFCRLFILIALIFSNVRANAQPYPFGEQISRFRQQDSISFPEEGQILFVGSFTFTLWHDVADYFPDYPIINRGFGGSAFPDLIYYANDVILPYQPKQIVIDCGENDFSLEESLSAEVVAGRFEQLFTEIRAHLPETHVASVSMKPCPSLAHLMEKFELANKLIQSFLAEKKNTTFIDVYHAMLNEDGTPKQEIFKGDNLHMNEKGYQLWPPIIEPNLLK
jgi:lysophospholipase L1-like esterase